MMRYLSPAGRLAPRRIFQFVCVLLGAVAWFPHFANAAILRPGDLLVTDAGIDNSQTIYTANGAVFLVDPQTGVRSILSGRGIGGGPELFTTFGVAVGPDGQVYVADTAYDASTSRYRDRIIRIDPTTGDRTVVSGSGIGGGPEFRDPPPGAIAPRLGPLTFDSSGNMIVGEGRDQNLAQGAAIYRVDVATGDRQLVSGLGVGMGEALNGSDYNILVGASDIVVDPRSAGRLLVSGESLLEVDVASGNWKEFAGDLGEFFQVFAILGGLDVSDDGRFVILADDGMIFTFDRDTSQLSGISLPSETTPADVSFAPGETAIYGLRGDSIALFERVSGDRTVISGEGMGSGPDFESLTYLYVVVPEPAAIFLVVSALPLIVVMRWFRK